MDGVTRPSSERDGACICDYDPSTTDGPDECCPFHGRPYQAWVERGDRLQERLTEAVDAATEIADKHMDAVMERRRAEARATAAEAALARIALLCGDNAWLVTVGEPPNEDIVPGVRESDLLAALASDSPAPEGGERDE